MTRKRRFGNSRDSYSPYGLLVLISLVSLALAGCSRASPRAEEATTADPDMTPEISTPEISPQSTVTILADSATVVAGEPVSYTVNASPAPVADLTVHVEYTNTEVDLAAEPPPATITIDAGSDAAMLTVQTATGPGGTITASVTEGDGYTVGPADSASASVTVTASSTGPTGPVTTGPVIIRPPPPANSVTITAVADSVVEGNPVQFTVTAEPAPAEDLTLSVSVTQTTPERATGNLPTSVTILQSTSSTELTLTTTDDSVTQSAGTVTATLTAVSPATYSIGSPASATVTITDNDQSIVTIGLPDSVSAGAVLTITVNMSPALAVAQTIGVAVRDYGPEPALVAIYHIEFSVGATSGTAEHTVATGHANADDRIRVEIFDPAPNSPYVRGSPYRGSVDVS